MGSELAMEPASFEVIASLRGGDDLRSELSYSPLKDDLVVSDKALGSGETAEDGLDGSGP